LRKVPLMISFALTRQRFDHAVRCSHRSTFIGDPGCHVPRRQLANLKRRRLHSGPDNGGRRYLPFPLSFPLSRFYPDFARGATHCVVQITEVTRARRVKSHSDPPVSATYQPSTRRVFTGDVLFRLCERTRDNYAGTIEIAPEVISGRHYLARKV